MCLSSSVWFPLLLALAACRTETPRAEPVRELAPVAAAPVPSALGAASEAGAATEWQGASEVESALGNYRVFYRTHPTPVPRGESFALDVWVLAAKDGTRPLADVRLEPDAGMPEHGHGMNRVPSVVQVSPGRFRVEGMYFHMPGPWELYFDVRRGARIERARVALELE